MIGCRFFYIFNLERAWLQYNNLKAFFHYIKSKPNESLSLFIWWVACFLSISSCNLSFVWLFCWETLLGRGRDTEEEDAGGRVAHWSSARGRGGRAGAPWWKVGEAEGKRRDCAHHDDDVFSSKWWIMQEPRKCSAQLLFSSAPPPDEYFRERWKEKLRFSFECQLEEAV